MQYEMRGWAEIEKERRDIAKHAVQLVKNRMGDLRQTLDEAQKAVTIKLMEEVGRHTYDLGGAIYNLAENGRAEFSKKNLTAQLIPLLREAKFIVMRGQELGVNTAQRALNKIDATMRTLQAVKDRKSLTKIACAYAQQRC